MDKVQTATNHNTRAMLTGFSMVVLAALGFASKGVLIKLAYAGDPTLDAISLMAIRMLIALPFFIFIVLHRNHVTRLVPLSASDWLVILALGFLGYYLSSLLDFSGLVYISASLERMILYLYPTIVVLISALLNRRGILAHESAALVVAYLGIVLMFVNGQTAINDGIIRGTMLVFASAFSFAVFMVASHHVIAKIGAIRFTSYSMAAATLFTLLHYTLQHGMQLFDQRRDFYLTGLLLAIFCTVLPSYLMNAGIQRIGASRTALVSTIGPVMTLGLAYLFLGETLTGVQIFGIMLVIGSLYIIGTRRA